MIVVARRGYPLSLVFSQSLPLGERTDGTMDLTKTEDFRQVCMSKLLNVILLSRPEPAVMLFPLPVGRTITKAFIINLKNGRISLVTSAKMRNQYSMKFQIAAMNKIKRCKVTYHVKTMT